MAGRGVWSRAIIAIIAIIACLPRAIPWPGRGNGGLAQSGPGSEGGGDAVFPGQRWRQAAAASGMLMAGPDQVGSGQTRPAFQRTLTVGRELSPLCTMAERCCLVPLSRNLLGRGWLGLVPHVARSMTFRSESGSLARRVAVAVGSYAVVLHVLQRACFLSAGGCGGVLPVHSGMHSALKGPYPAPCAAGRHAALLVCGIGLFQAVCIPLGGAAVLARGQWRRPGVAAPRLPAASLSCLSCLLGGSLLLGPTRGTMMMALTRPAM